MKICEFQCHASLAWKCLFTPRRPLVTTGDSFWGRVTLKSIVTILVCVRLVINLWRFAPTEKSYCMFCIYFVCIHQCKWPFGPTSAFNNNNNKYVSGDWPISTHADPTSTRRAVFHERRISSVTFTSAHLYGNVYIAVGVACALAGSSDFGLRGEQSSQKFVILCLGRRCSKMWRR